MPPRLTLPAPPADARAKKAARQARWRANAKRKAAVAAAIDASMGVGPPADLPALAPVDLAKLLRDRYHAIVNAMDDSELLDKDFAPSLGVGLRAQSALDARVKVQAQAATAELGRAILDMLSGRPPLELADGRTIDGEATEIEAD